MLSRLARALPLLVALLLAPLAAPAAAEAAAAPHCVHNVSDRTYRCYATFTEAIAAATGGAVKDAPADASAAVTDPALAAEIDAAPIDTARAAVLGIAYRDANYGSPSVTWTAPSGCDSSLDVDWEVDNVGSTWNDRISSARSFSTCQSRYWEHAFQAGAATAWFVNLSFFGSMNDRATSIQFR